MRRLTRLLLVSLVNGNEFSLSEGNIEVNSFAHAQAFIERRSSDKQQHNNNNTKKYYVSAPVVPKAYDEVIVIGEEYYLFFYYFSYSGEREV